ncbi:four helix bundle protein [Sphingobacterium sp. SGG-5]|uniref:four helix bundle protein n=1 Tax=Sphingobacterium sp. SGG-5 TaxID=2710881 RepID=UPI0013EE12E0|nr:four helix bundle protein [Sphingobacterium sp. SGG-5]NGM60746.1 four helix bundle protein [Sphingobacterium sp. SGG-5]
MHNIQDLKIWHRAIDLCTLIYKISAEFPSDERFGLISQIRRSCVSVASNIAEGAGRNTNGEFIQFLGIANGSAYELQTQVIIAQKLGLFSTDSVLVLDKIDEIQKMCYKLQQSLKK